MIKYFLKDLQNIDQQDFDDISELFMVSFPNSVGLSGLINGHKQTPFSLFFARKDSLLIFVSLVFPSHPTLYLYYVCVNPNFRGTGVFKHAFRRLKTIYTKKGYTTYALDVSQEENVPPGITQAKRLQIFNRLGFHLVPFKNPSPFTKHANLNTYVTLKSGRGQLLERYGDTYKILMTDGNVKKVGLGDILGCLDDLDSVGPDLCPMQTVSSIVGGTRRRRCMVHTRKRRV
jgi:hypothetical protein